MSILMSTWSSFFSYVGKDFVAIMWKKNFNPFELYKKGKKSKFLKNKPWMWYNQEEDKSVMFMSKTGEVEKQE